MIAELAVSRAL